MADRMAFLTLRWNIECFYFREELPKELFVPFAFLSQHSNNGDRSETLSSFIQN
uniref:Protein kinase domain-containing protein n=1 Tax=Parascaris univalens TaxID=6257 RepID=A0A914ZY88_PARUN